MSDITSHQDPDQIRREIEETRASLQNKLEALQAEVKDTVETAKTKMTVEHQVRQHPLLALSGAMGAGYLVGRMLTPRPAPAPASEPKVSFLTQAAPALLVARAVLNKTFAKDISEGKKLALGVGLGVVRELVMRAVPPIIAERSGQAVDELTRTLGVNPLRFRLHQRLA